jgi:hypothetical protein
MVQNHLTQAGHGRSSNGEGCTCKVQSWPKYVIKKNWFELTTPSLLSTSWRHYILLPIISCKQRSITEKPFFRVNKAALQRGCVGTYSRQPHAMQAVKISITERLCRHLHQATPYHASNWWCQRQGVWVQRHPDPDPDSFFSLWCTAVQTLPTLSQVHREVHKCINLHKCIPCQTSTRADACLMECSFEIRGCAYFWTLWWWKITRIASVSSFNLSFHDNELDLITDF